MLINSTQQQQELFNCEYLYPVTATTVLSNTKGIALDNT